MPDTDITPPKPPSAPGLINSVAQAPTPAPLSSGAVNNLSQIGLAQSDIDTAGHVAAVKDPNSALMKQATGNVNMDFARRGLLNSSAAAQSADEAMTTKALDIVSPDIDRLVAISRGNADNTAAMAREQAQIAGQTNIAGINNSAAMERAKFGAGADQALAMLNNSSALERTMAQLSAEDKRQLTDIQSRFALQGQQLSAADSQQLRELQSRASLQASGDASAMARTQAQLTANEQSQLRDLESRASLQGQQLSAGEAQQLRDLQSRRDIAQMQVDANKGASDQNLANSLKLLDAQTQKSLQVGDANASHELQGAYRTATQGTYDSYLRDVQAIQTSGDMDAETKQAQIGSLNQLYTQRQAYVNTLYQAVPGWHDEWSQLAVQFGGAAAAPVDERRSVDLPTAGTV